MGKSSVVAKHIVLLPENLAIMVFKFCQLFLNTPAHQSLPGNDSYLLAGPVHIQGVQGETMLHQKGLRLLQNGSPVLSGARAVRLQQLVDQTPFRPQRRHTAEQGAGTEHLVHMF